MHKKTFITKSKAGHYTVTIKRGPRTVFKQGLISCLAWAREVAATANGDLEAKA